MSEGKRHSRWLRGVIRVLRPLASLSKDRRVLAILILLAMPILAGALIMLLLSVAFPFVSFEARGVSNRIELTETASTLVGFHEPPIPQFLIHTNCILYG